MKFTTVLLVFSVLFAAAFGARPTPPRKCDYRCTDLDLTACASNGVCFNSFPSECQMAKYNCLFPDRPFTKVPDSKCKDKSLPLCTIDDL